MAPRPAPPPRVHRRRTRERRPPRPRRAGRARAADPSAVTHLGASVSQAAADRSTTSNAGAIARRRPGVGRDESPRRRSHVERRRRATASRRRELEPQPARRQPADTKRACGASQRPAASSGRSTRSRSIPADQPLAVLGLAQEPDGRPRSPTITADGDPEQERALARRARPPRRCSARRSSRSARTPPPTARSRGR